MDPAGQPAETDSLDSPCLNIAVLTAQEESNSARFGPVAYPAVGVTPPRHVDAVVAEHGQFPPESIVVLMRELFGGGVGEPRTERR